MSDLTREDEDLLERAREGLSPRPEDHARIKRRLVGRIAGSVAASAALASAEAAAMTGTVGAAGLPATLGVAKLVAAAALAAAVVGGGLLASRKTATPPAPVAPSQSVARALAPSAGPVEPSDRPPSPSPVRAEREPATASGAPAPSLPPKSEPSDRARGPSSASPAPEPAHGVGAPARSPEPATEVQPVARAAPSQVAAEADLLARSDAALKAGDARGALALLEEHAASYPSGMLAEEREAERVVVLCALGRTADSRAAAVAFLRDHARSPMAARVRGTCGSAPIP